MLTGTKAAAVGMPATEGGSGVADDEEGAIQEGRTTGRTTTAAPPRATPRETQDVPTATGAETAVTSTMQHLARVGRSAALNPPKNCGAAWGRVLQTLASARATTTMYRGAQLIRRVADHAEARGIDVDDAQLQQTILVWLESEELRDVTAATRRTYAVTLVGLVQRYLPQEPLHLLRQYAEAQSRRTAGPTRQAKELAMDEEATMLEGLDPQHAAVVALMVAAGLRCHEALRAVAVDVADDGRCRVTLRGPTKTRQQGAVRCVDCRLTQQQRRAVANWMTSQPHTADATDAVFRCTYAEVLAAMRSHGATTHSAKRTHHRRLVRMLLGLSVQEIMVHTGHRTEEALSAYLGPELYAEMRLAHTDRVLDAEFN